MGRVFLKRDTVKLVIYTCLIFAYVMNVFVALRFLEYAVGILAAVSILISFRGSLRLFQFTGTVFLLTGLGLYALYGLPWADLPYYLTSTVVLLALFYVLPFINSIILVGRYDRSMNKLLQNHVEHLGQLYCRSSLVSFLLGTFLNIAMIPFVLTVLQKNLREQAQRLRHIFISRTMLRGYALCLAWSPMEVQVALSVDITGVNYLSFLPWLLLFSLTLLLSDWLTGWFRYRRQRLNGGENNVSGVGRLVLKKIGVLLAYLALFIVLVVIVVRLLNVDFLLAVTLVIVPYSFFWAISIRRLKSYLVYSRRMWRVRTSSMQSYVLLFLSIGFFIRVLKETDLIHSFQQPFLQLATAPVLLLLFIQFLFLLLAMIGFHPLVTMSILGEFVQPLLSQINPLSIGIVLITSGLSTVAAGPYNLTVTLTGSLLQENPYRLSWWNLGFALAFGGWGTMLAVFLL